MNENTLRRVVDISRFHPAMHDVNNPAKALDEEVINLRSSMPRGWTNSSQQVIGLERIGQLFEAAESDESFAWLSHFVAGAMLTTAYCNRFNPGVIGPGDKSVGRAPIYLPNFEEKEELPESDREDGRTEYKEEYSQLTKKGLLMQSGEHLKLAIAAARTQVEVIEQLKVRSTRLTSAIFRNLGASALTLASTDNLELINSLEDPHMRQQAAWEAGQEAQYRSHSLLGTTGIHPTAINLADRHGDLMIQLDQTAPIELRQVEFSAVV